jgi:hypothetical protein
LQIGEARRAPSAAFRGCVFPPAPATRAATSPPPVYGVARLAARIYAAALVRGGARLNWRSAVRLRVP